MFACVTAAISIACGGSNGDPASPSPQSPTPTIAEQTANAALQPTSTPSPGRWNNETVWNFDAKSIEATCATPLYSVLDITCALDAMVAAGADSSAVGFVEQTNYFLIEFEESGAIDTGVAQTPWSNMSRPEIVFLNGDPNVILVGQLIPTTWEEDDRYRAIIVDAASRDEFVAVWPEYAHFTQQADGQFVVSYPLGNCRSCDMYALLRVQLDFDEHGILVDQFTLPPIYQ